ncbi:hypothetical protein [Kitasatospora sp. NPDC059327]|uniref:hypothetical protein n=1 Tax=Kitasatospora sp. NPDC059327 TaxID=3346803 RepID=UPI0036A852AE
MVDFANLPPRSRGGPARRRQPIRPWHGAVAAVLAAAAAVGLRAWQPWRSVELPTTACWNALGREDLRPLAGPDGKALEPVPTVRIATPLAPESPPERRRECVVRWGKYWMLNADVRPATAGPEADRAADARYDRVVPLDFGAGTVAWGVAPKSGGNPKVRLYVRCDFEIVPKQPTEKAPPYFRVDVAGDHLPGADADRAGQAYGNIALKVAQAAATEYACADAVQLPATAPTVPALTGGPSSG